MHALALLLAAALAVDSTASRRAAPETEFPVVLGSYSTTLIGSSPARTANLRLAAAALDGEILRSGEELSFNAVVGPRTTARGYQVAPVILRDERQSQTGGGICQVASTLFCAALLTGLTVTERYRHSSPVDYIALGQDATIAWGFRDLKIRNDLEQRVRLKIAVLGATFSARFEGEWPLETTYDLRTEEREIPEASEAHLPGREIELYRVHHVAGQDVERELIHRDDYPSLRARGPAARER